ncbi:MAG: hypothetical protein MZV63_58495 [Marinilabiliales bacterium]|nr:hypothetical protein [Marinilabiliales bacterium]
MSYYPGNVTLRLADVVVINKIDSADADGIDTVRRNIAAVNPKAVVVDAASVLAMDNPGRDPGQAGAGRRGRADAHPRRDEDRRGGGGGAQVRGGGARRPPAVPGGQAQGHLPDLPGHRHAAAGHGLRSRSSSRTSRATINRTQCDAVVIGTPIDLNRIITIKKPSTRVYYNLQEIGQPDLDDVLEAFIRAHTLGRKRSVIAATAIFVRNGCHMSTNTALS